MINFSEIDKYATTSYCAIHNVNEELNLGDITRIDETRMEDFDLMTYGFPCITGDALVLTDNGFKQIKDIQKGMKVLSHDNKYHYVTDCKTTGIKETYKINAMSFHELNATDNHLFYVRKRYFEWNNGLRRDVRKFTNPVWLPCSKLNKDYYLGYAINQENKLPNWKGIYFGKNKSQYQNNLNMTDKELWYICGRYLGDGWIKKRNDRNDDASGVIICCGKHKTDIFENKIKKYHYTKAEDRTTYKYHFSNKELALFVSQFGRGAINKHIPDFVYDMPIEYIKSILEGYFDSDGYECQQASLYYKGTSISKELIYGLGQLIAKSYHRPFSIYKETRPNKVVIENRVVNQHTELYCITFKKEKGKQDKAFYDNGYIWFPINKVIKNKEVEKVYDLTVEDAHSFTANGCIVHNCQDISLAGKQKGFTDKEGNKTRSGLFFDALRIIEEKKPKIAIAENVKNLTSKKFQKEFDIVLTSLNEAGYNNYWKVLNAKDFGIPQNRERVFIVSIRKDIDNGMFEFPKGFDLKLRLKDMLEDEVDEKYYLSKKVQDRLIITDPTFTKSIVGTTKPECRTIGQRDLVYQENSIMGTLVATDYKQPKQILEVRRIGGVFDDEKSKHQAGSIYDTEGLAPTLDTMQGGYRQPCIPIKEATKKGYAEAEVGDSINLEQPNSKTRRGRVGKQVAQTLTTSCNQAVVTPKLVGGIGDKNFGNQYRQGNRVYDSNEIAMCLTSQPVGNTGGNSYSYQLSDLRIRKLTPLECWRLMGFSDDQFFKAKKSLNDKYYKGKDKSNSQLYKQAGNSIVVDVLFYIFIELYKTMPQVFNDLKVTSLFSGIGAFEVALDRLYELLNQMN